MPGEAAQSERPCLQEEMAASGEFAAALVTDLTTRAENSTTSDKSFHFSERIIILKRFPEQT